MKNRNKINSKDWPKWWQVIRKKMATRENSLLITKAKFNGYDEFNYYDEQRLLRLVSNNGPVEKMSRGVDQTEGILS